MNRREAPGWANSMRVEVRELIELIMKEGEVSAPLLLIYLKYQGLKGCTILLGLCILVLPVYILLGLYK